jgi:hypothetical protein
MGTALQNKWANRHILDAKRYLVLIKPINHCAYKKRALAYEKTELVE